MKVKVVIGISNSGKSTFIKENYPKGVAYGVFSTDNWFTKDGGSYVENFDPQDLPEAHGWNKRECIEAMQRTSPLNNPWAPYDWHIIVDNTNTTVAEIAPYAEMALAYQHSLELIVVHCPLDVALSRDNGHGTPEIAIRGQHARLTKLLKKHPEKGYFLEIPSWWPVREVPYVE